MLAPAPSTDSSPFLAAALAYAEHGWAIFPLQPGSKKPFAGSRGFKDATRDPAQIQAWWQAHPDANIGIATGAQSGISVLDVDVKLWAGKAGDETIRALTEAHGELPTTLVQKTWSGGLHIVFAYTPQMAHGAGKYGRDLDSRNDGGYIVAAPSRVIDEAREGVYAWLTDPRTTPLAPMPEWLLGLGAATNGHYGPKRRASTLRPIHELAASGRNSALTSLAGTMRRRDASEDAIRQALLAENATFPIPLAVDEVEQIVQSAMRNFAAAKVTELDARLTDQHDAEALLAVAGERIRYCDAEQRWYVFDGRRWTVGTRNKVIPYVTQLARSRYQQAAVERDADKRKRLATAAQRLENARVMRGVVELAQPLSFIEPGDFDKDEHLLNVENGVLDLRTGVLLAHDPKYLMTRLAPVTYDPGTVSQLWDDTIKLTTRGDLLLAAFLQRAVGYALTGYTSENVFFVLYGPQGRNGKTTIVTAVSTMLGDYATTLRVEAILAGGEHKIPHDLADLRGARFVVTSEMPKGKRYDENKLKMLTGDDEVTACFKFGHNFRYYPALKLFMHTNHRPEFSGGDEALWARALTVPFLFNFRQYEGHDKNAKERLREPEHRAAILAWAVRGCLAWQRDGSLGVPAQVLEETAKHRKEVDVIQAFLDECCDRTDSPDAWVSGRELYRAYHRWSREQANPEKHTEMTFGAEMTRLGHELAQTWSSGRNRVTRWKGLYLKSIRG